MQPAVYIMACMRDGMIYTGVTSGLVQRITQHREGEIAGFTARYNCKLLVYYEIHGDMIGALEREKQIKGGSSKKKTAFLHTKLCYPRYTL